MTSAQRGGKSVYGASIGILMLETRFPRIPGDVGNADTWPFPVLYRVVRDASPDRVVRQGGSRSPRRLRGGGEGPRSRRRGRTHHELRLPRPPSGGVGTRLRGAGRHFVAHAGSGRRSPAPARETGRHPHHLAGFPHRGAPLPRGSSARRTRSREPNTAGNSPASSWTTSTSSTSSLRDRTWWTGRGSSSAATPEVGAIVLECTNMCPYSADVAEAVGLPVYDFVSFVNWFRSGLAPRRF